MTSKKVREEWAEWMAEPARKQKKMDSMCEPCNDALYAGLHSTGHEGASDGELWAALNGEHPPVEPHDCLDDARRGGNSWAGLFEPGCECDDHTEGS